MSGKKAIKQFFSITVIILSGVIFSFAQNAELVKFEKSIEQGNLAEVERDVLNYAIKNPKDAKGFELLGKIRLKQNRSNEAKSLFNRALLLNPNLTTAKIKLAETFYKTGEIENAQNLLNEISENEITDEETRLNLAEIYSSIGNCEKSLTLAEKLSLKTKNTKALSLRANCFIKTGDTKKLNDLIPLAKNLSKNDFETALQFAELLQNASMQKESAEISKSILKQNPANENALILLAKSEILLKDFPSAKNHISQIEKLNPESAEILFLKGLLESKQGNDLQAIEFFEKFLAQNSNSIEGLSRFTISAMRANYAGKAVKSAERLLQLQPSNPEFLYLLGAASLQTGDLETAETSLKKFLEIVPNDSQGCLALGLTYAAQPEKLADARSQMSGCISANPNNYEAKYQLGLSYKTQGETKKAIPYLEEVIAQKADYANALRDLGILYLQDGQEQKARTVLEKAVSLNPKDADTHFQLSRLYNLIGEQILAKKHLKIFQELKNPKSNSM